MLRIKDLRIDIALFFIFLIVMLPLSSSAAWAASIRSPIKTYGSAGVEGFRAPEDTITIEAVVTHPEDPVLESNQIKILEDPTITFECSVLDETAMTSVCKHTYASTFVPSDYGFLDFTLQVMTDLNTPMSSPVKGRITIDSIAPKIDSVSYTANSSSSVTAKFYASDKACESSQCKNLCSGVQQVSFLLDGESIATKDYQNASCLVNGEVSLEGLVGTGVVETKTICAKATDVMGLSSTSCKSVTFDTKPPEVTGVALLGLNDEPITYANGKPLNNVKLVVNITEDSGLVNPRDTSQKESIIYVNASDLVERPDHRKMLENLGMSGCLHVTDNTYTCSANIPFFVMTEERDVSITVQATDSWNNSAEVEKSLDISLDKGAPVATRIYTDYLDDKGNYWLNTTGNNVYVDIKDDGSGMAGRRMYMDFRELNNAAPSVEGGFVNRANECEKGWKCTWKYIDSTKGDGQKWTALTSPVSSDDAGNLLAPFSTLLRTDTVAPELLVTNITAISDIGEFKDIGSGDLLNVKVILADYTPVNAYANFSSVLQDGLDMEEATCAEINDTNLTANLTEEFDFDTNKRLWECTWETGPVIEVPYFQTMPYTNTTIPFTFKDLVGHESTDTTKISILGKENVTADYWEAEWISSSPQIDRFAWAIGQPVSYQHIAINPRFNVGLARIISYELDPSLCTGDIDFLLFSDSGEASVIQQGFDLDYSDGIDDMIIMELNPGNVPPLSITDENNNTIPYNSFNVTCPARIISVVGDARISTVETENITMFVNVFSNPIGENLNNVKDQVDKWQKTLSADGWKAISIPKLIFHYAEIVCNILHAINQLIMIYTAITQGIGAVSRVYAPAKGPSQAANGGVTASTTAQTGLLDKLGQFCGLVISCRHTNPESVDGYNKKTKKCAPKSSWFCNFAVGWSKINGWWLDIMIPDKLQETKGKIPSVARGTAFKNLPVATKEQYGAGFDVKKSLISSTLSLCIPGIINGIDKYRQVACTRLMCYKVDIASGAETADGCDRAYVHSVCKYVIGDVWNAIPWAQYLDTMMGLVKGLLKNPIEVVGYAIDASCAHFCSLPGPGCGFCTGLKWVNLLAGTAASIKGVVDQIKSPPDDMCKEALKDEPSYSNLPGFPKEADPAETMAAANEESATPVEDTTTTEGEA